MKNKDDLDDFFIYSKNPKKPSPSDSDMIEFMRDLNKFKIEKEREKIKIKNE